MFFGLQWKELVDGRPGKFTSDDRAKMFIAWQAYKGIKLTVHSSIELTRFLLNNDIEFVLSERYSQDILENYNGRQRALGCCKDNPTLKDTIILILVPVYFDLFLIDCGQHFV